MNERGWLHKLVDAIPEPDLPHIRAAVARLIANSAGRGSDDDLIHALEAAPLDDEPLTDDDLAAIAEARNAPRSTFISIETIEGKLE